MKEELKRFYESISKQVTDRTLIKIKTYKWNFEGHIPVFGIKLKYDNGLKIVFEKWVKDSNYRIWVSRGVIVKTQYCTSDLKESKILADSLHGIWEDAYSKGHKIKVVGITNKLRKISRNSLKE